MSNLFPLNSPRLIFLLTSYSSYFKVQNYFFSSQRPTLFSSVHMGTSAQAQPILACITLWRIKHPMYTAKSCTACAPGTWVWPSSAPCPAKVSERDKWGPAHHQHKQGNK